VENRARFGGQTVRLVSRWAVVTTVGVGVLSLLFPALAPADTTAPVTGGSWYWNEQLANINTPAGPIASPTGPIAPPDVPAGDFAVAVLLGQSDKETYLHIDTSAVTPGSTVSSLILTLKEDAAAPGNINQAAAKIEARAVTGFFGDGTQAAPYAERPTYDTTGPAAPGQKAGDTWTFDLTPLAQAWAQGTQQNNGIALVPAAPTQGDVYEVVWHGSGDQAPKVGGSFTPATPSAPPAALTEAPVETPAVAITPDFSSTVAAPESLPTFSASQAPTARASGRVSTPGQRIQSIAQGKPHRALPWAFWLAIVAVIGLVGASTLALGELGEPALERRGSVLRTLERRNEELSP
jgi:hypothetical protein